MHGNWRRPRSFRVPTIDIRAVAVSYWVRVRTSTVEGLIVRDRFFFFNETYTMYVLFCQSHAWRRQMIDRGKGGQTVKKVKKNMNTKQEG